MRPLATGPSRNLRAVPGAGAGIEIIDSVWPGNDTDAVEGWEQYEMPAMLVMLISVLPVRGVEMRVTFNKRNSSTDTTAVRTHITKAKTTFTSGYTYS